MKKWRHIYLIYYEIIAITCEHTECANIAGYRVRISESQGYTPTKDLQNTPKFNGALNGITTKIRGHLLGFCDKSIPDFSESGFF